MPTITLPLPSIPPGTAMIKAVHVWFTAFPFRESYYNHWFTATPSSVALFDIIVGANNALNFWVRPFYANQLPTNMGSVALVLFANICGRTQCMSLSPGGFANAAGPAVSAMLKPRFFRASRIVTPQIRGRGSFLPVIASFLDHNYLTLAARTFYEAKLVLYNQTWVSQGVTFTPAIASPTRGIVSELTTLAVTHQPGMDRKARFKDAAHSNLYRFPFTP